MQGATDLSQRALGFSLLAQGHFNPVALWWQSGLLYYAQWRRRRKKTNQTGVQCSRCLFSVPVVLHKQEQWVTRWPPSPRRAPWVLSLQMLNETQGVSFLWPVLEVRPPGGGLFPKHRDEKFFFLFFAPPCPPATWLDDFSDYHLKSIQKIWDAFNQACQVNDLVLFARSLLPFF